MKHFQSHRRDVAQPRDLPDIPVKNHLAQNGNPKLDSAHP
jgi:hypothetical protein